MLCGTVTGHVLCCIGQGCEVGQRHIHTDSELKLTQELIQLLNLLKVMKVLVSSETSPTSSVIIP